MPISAETPCATQNEYVYSSKKLSALERGLAQKIFVSVVYILSATILAFGLEWLDRHAYLKIVSQAESQGKISESVSRLFIQLIDARSDFIHIVLFGLFCGLIVLAILYNPVDSQQHHTDFPYRTTFPYQEKLAANARPPL